MLALLDAKPREETLREELRLIRESGAPPGEQVDLLAIATQIALKSFPRSLVDAVFQKAGECRFSGRGPGPGHGSRGLPCGL